MSAKISPDRDRTDLIPRFDFRAFVIGGGRSLVFFYGLNVLMFVLSRAFGDERVALVDVDYALAPLLDTALRRANMRQAPRLALLLITVGVAVVADILSVVSRIFLWEPGAITDYMFAFRDLPWRLLMLTAFAVLLATVIAAAVLRPRDHRPRNLGPLLFSLLLLWTVDCIAGRSALGGDVYYLPNLLSSAAEDLVLPAVRQTIEEPPALRRIATPTMASEIAAIEPKLHEILSIAVESWGWLNSAGERASLIAPLIDGLAGDYRVSSIEGHRFTRSTLTGEIRELCGLTAAGRPSAAGQLAQMRDCLPNQLARAGYATVAFHGNGGSFYRREQVYRVMGFQAAHFYADLVADGAALCLDTTFKGICDRDIFARALASFDGRPRFVHVMTLDSHLPIAGAQSAQCPLGLVAEPAICRQANVLRATFAALAAQIRAMPRANRPDVLFLYGDHRPPFFQAATRDRFSTTVVPFVVLSKISPPAAPSVSMEASHSKISLSPRAIALLDATRAAAAFYVVLHHLTHQAIIPGWIGIPFHFGQEAVIVFFLLSGFVIFANEHHRVDRPASYFWRRIRRIYPPLLLAMLASVLVRWDNGTLQMPFPWGEGATTLLALQDLPELKPGVIAAPFLGNDPLWSLSYEAAFYLAFPLAMRGWRRWPRVTTHIIGASACIAYLVYAAWPGHLALCVAYFPLWWTGAMAAYAYGTGRFGLRALSPMLGWLGGLTLAGGIVLAIVGYRGLGLYPALPLRHFTAALVLALLACATRLVSLMANLSHGVARPLGYIASISYGVYVLHFPLLIQWRFAMHSFAGLATATVMLSILATLADRVLGRIVSGRLLIRPGRN